MVYLTLLLTTFDQLTKYLIPTLNPPLWIIQNELGLEITRNTGGAFSLPIPPFLTIPLAITIIIGLYVWYQRSFARSRLAQTTVALILAGSLGNLIDRLIQGSVIDFIKIFSWPTFNVADSYITIGTIILILFFDKIHLES